MDELLVPISIGELYDKITILRLKQTKIKDKSKLYNINKELNLLLNISKKYPIDSEFYFNLFNINNKIWKIEDEIRKEEKTRDWGSRFVTLARSVYFENDLRSTIKKEINVKYGSNVIEEKSYEEY